MNSSTSSSPDAGDPIRVGTYYGNGIPYLPIDGYPGKIIAIEGTDGVGRSTQLRCISTSSDCFASSRGIRRQSAKRC